MDFDEFPPVDAAARATSVFCDRCDRLARAKDPLPALGTCQRCGRHFDRPTTIGQHPKWCADCRKARKNARGRAYYAGHKYKWREYQARKVARREPHAEQAFVQHKSDYDLAQKGAHAAS